MEFEEKYKMYKEKFLEMKNKNDALESALEDNKEEVLQITKKYDDLRINLRTKVSEQTKYIRKEIDAKNKDFKELQKTNKQLLDNEKIKDRTIKQLENKIISLEKELDESGENDDILAAIKEDMTLYGQRRSMMEVNVGLTDILKGKSITVRKCESNILEEF